MVLSKAVCDTEVGAVDRIVHFMRGCNRSQPHLDLLKSANAVLAHMARYQQLHSALLASPDCVPVIVEQLQMFRDREVSHCYCCHAYCRISKHPYFSCFPSALLQERRA